MKSLSYYAIVALLGIAFVTHRVASAWPSALVATGAAALALAWALVCFRKPPSKLRNPRWWMLLIALAGMELWVALSSNHAGLALWVTALCLAFSAIQTFDSRTRDDFLRLSFRATICISIASLVLLAMRWSEPGFVPALALAVMPLSFLSILHPRGGSVKHYLSTAAMLAALIASGLPYAWVACAGSVVALMFLLKIAPSGRLPFRLAALGAAAGAMVLAAGGIRPLALAPGTHEIPNLAIYVLLAAWALTACSRNIWCVGPLSVLAMQIADPRTQSPEMTLFVVVMLSAANLGDD